MSHRGRPLTVHRTRAHAGADGEGSRTAFRMIDRPRPRANVSSRPFSVTQLRIRNGSYCPKATLPARSGNGEVGSKADSHKATPGRVLRYQALNKTRPGPGPPHLGAAATARLESRS